MDWIQATIYTTNAGIEPVTGRLYQLGVTGTEIEDEQEFNEFLEDNQKYWDYVDDGLRRKMSGETKVKVYLSDNASGREMLLSIRESMRELKAGDPDGTFGRLETSLANLQEEDWAENWKQYFKPIAVGDNILIKPVWEPLPKGGEDKTVFVIEPGMVFGTGTHESTRLCLWEAERFVRKGDRVLDLGCGSGILSIVALLLGAEHAVAADIDPNAKEIAYHNAEINGIGKDRYEVLSGDVLSDGALKQKIGSGYDVVFANIVADVIIALAPVVSARLKRGGVFIASGIISERGDEVARVLGENGLRVLEWKEEKGWRCFVCTNTED